MRLRCVSAGNLGVTVGFRGRELFCKGEERIKGRKFD